MHKEHILVGKAYVNEAACVLREVVEELDRNSVRCSSFDLATGRLLPTRHSNWNRAQLARWADREATAPEVALVHPYQHEAWFDILFPSGQPGVLLEDARTAIDGRPGRQMFPVGK